MVARGVAVLVALGDFGFVWPERNRDRNLNKLSRCLQDRGQTLYWVDCNHEDFRTLYAKFALTDDGQRPIRDNIIHLPRGYRTTLASGKTMAVRDEANPIDRNWRVEGHRWWPEESITEAELRTLGSEHADLLVGHDAPLHLPSLHSHLRSTATLGDHRRRAFAEAGRRMFHRGFLQVQPALYVGGH